MFIFLVLCVHAVVADVKFHATLFEEGVCAGPACTETLEEMVEGAMSLTTTNPAAACKATFALLMANREPGPPAGSFGMPLTKLEILNAGIGELAAQGLLRSLEAETTPSGKAPPGMLCWMSLAGLGVQYDHERSLAAYEHAPSLWEAVVAWNKRVRSSHDQLCFSVMMIAGLFGRPPSDQCLRDMDKAGAFDFIFDVLEHNASDLVLMQAAWAGLSDNVENTRVGAELVADKGGIGKGLEFLIGLLPAYRGKHAYQPHMQYGLRYESIHDIAGILMHDDEQHTWQNVAAKAGYMEEAIAAMQDEPTDHLTQENCCEAVTLMGRGSAENMARLDELGAIELMAATISTFKEAPYDGYYHLNSCAAGLLLFANEGSAYQDRMLQLNVLDNIATSNPIWRETEHRNEPWASAFPWSNVTSLQEILTKRRDGGA